jgi:hypothetical protein
MAGFTIGKKFGPAIGGLGGLFISGGNPFGGVAGLQAGGVLGGGLDELLNYLINPQDEQAANAQAGMAPMMQQQQMQNNPNIDYIRQQLRNPNVAYDPRGFDAIRNLAREQFRNQTIPDIQERFTGLGASRSSALPGALSGAGANLQAQLTAMRNQYAAQRGQSNLARLGALGGLEGGQQRLGLENQLLGLRQQQLNQQQQQQNMAGDFLAPQNYLQLLNMLGGFYGQNEQAIQGQQGLNRDYALGVQRYAQPQQAPHIGVTPATQGLNG